MSGVSASLLPASGEKVRMRGWSTSRNGAANHPAPHPRPLPACGERERSGGAFR
jgi:hypothetical protein